MVRPVSHVGSSTPCEYGHMGLWPSVIVFDYPKEIHKSDF